MEINFSDTNSKFLASCQQKKQIACIKSKNATFACMNKKCNKYAFTCSSQDCQCRKQHQFCLRIQIKSIYDSLRSNIVSLKQLEQSISEKIQQSIDQLSDFKDKLISKIKSGFQFHGLTKEQIQLVRSIKNGDVQKITGAKIWKVHYQTQKQNVIHSKMGETQKSVNKIWDDCLKQIKSFQGDVLNKLFEIDAFNYCYLNNINFLFQNSRVVKNLVQKRNFNQFFGDRKISSMKLLYQASEQGFDTQVFHQKCDKHLNTVVVCQTQYGKVVGGYTSINWRICQKPQCINDNSRSSFIFSLTNNAKFILQPEKSAIYCHKSAGPAFGNNSPDFFISDKANLNASWVNFNQSYKNQQYVQGSKQSWKMFSGNPNNKYFKVKQWQVWQINLKFQ